MDEGEKMGAYGEPMPKNGYWGIIRSKKTAYVGFGLIALPNLIPVTLFAWTHPSTFVAMTAYVCVVMAGIGGWMLFDNRHG